MVTFLGDGLTKGSQTGVTSCLDLLLQNTPDEKVQQVQIWRIWRPICRGSKILPCSLSRFAGWSLQCGPVPNPAGRHICYLDLSSGPRGPYAASERPDKCQCWPVEANKTFGHSGHRCPPLPVSSASEEPRRRERCRCWGLCRPHAGPSSSGCWRGWQPRPSWQFFHRKKSRTWLGSQAFSLLRSLQHLSFLISWAFSVRSSHCMKFSRRKLLNTVYLDVSHLKTNIEVLLVDANIMIKWLKYRIWCA